MSMNAWNDAQDKLKKAQKYVADIGREQRTTATAAGKWHALEVRTEIHFQYSDGNKNYHTCTEFDTALSTVVKNRLDELQEEAMALLENEVDKTGREARQSVQAMLDQIDAYER
jgi:phage-related minor tail protein